MSAKKPEIAEFIKKAAKKGMPAVEKVLMNIITGKHRDYLYDYLGKKVTSKAKGVPTQKAPTAPTIVQAIKVWAGLIADKEIAPMKPKEDAGTGKDDTTAAIEAVARSKQAEKKKKQDQNINQTTH